ncbi:MAG TPA: helix-turn-helix domain-containing protein [Sphingomicrobium sp.]|jgi:cytoskeletal protein RodZ|nr:helix-turn-helix domain-containing protein [Sphingomicrobium sp.]
MAKREIETEPMDEQSIDQGVPTVGEQLRAAREKAGVTLEDIAAQTRIPQRHLESIETAEWDKLPAPTYTIGFAKSYAGAVGLDRNEIGDQLREEMGGHRFASSQAEVIEAADPARTMPKWLVLSTVVAVVVIIVVMTILNRRSLEQPAPVSSNAPTPVAAAAPPPRQAPAPAPAAEGPVVLTAIAPAWIQVTDQGKNLFTGELQPGQTYSVPPTATAPLLKAGKPEALKVTVGSAVAPPVGPPGKVASKVSLKGPDLMHGGSQAQAPASAPAR